MSSINDSSIFRKNVDALAQQQGKKVCLVIQDYYGPIIGATLSIKGTTRGVISDIDGRACITVYPGETLVISYIGYQTIEIDYEDIPAGGMTITMKEDDEELDEVIV